VPVQTTVKTNIYIPDGCKAQIKATGDVGWTDFGALTGDCTMTWEWDENKVSSANAGTLRTVQKNHRVTGALTLQNLNPATIQKASGNSMELVQTAGSPIATIPNQTIAAGWADGVKYDLVMVVSSTDSTNVRTTAAPTLTSVTLDAAGTPEVLTAGNDYLVVADSNSPSGWVMTFMSAGMTTISPTTKAITIDYGSNTPVASDTLYAGSSSQTLDAYALKFEHTDSAGKIRSMELYSVNTNSGGFQFNFKSAEADGVEEMPLTFTANLDTTKANNRQLFAWTIENGAE